METVAKKLYEGLFLVDSAQAASDWDGVNEAIRKILDRSESEIISIGKWDERRLAYDIQKKSRGTYILCYFRTQGSRISGIERDVQLSEKIMRVMILNAEDFSQTDIDRETPAAKAKQALETAAAKAKLAEETAAAKEAEKPQAEEAVSVATAIEPLSAEEVKKPEETEQTEPEEIKQEEIEQVDENGG